MYSASSASATSSMAKVTSPPTATPAWSRAAWSPSEGSTTSRSRAQRSTSLRVVSFTHAPRSAGPARGRRPFYPAILGNADRLPIDGTADRHAPAARHSMTGPATPPAGVLAYRGGDGSIYLNLTNRCSCACTFCLREWTDGVYGENLRPRPRAGARRGHAGDRARVPRRAGGRGRLLRVRRADDAARPGARRHRVAAPASHPLPAGHQRPRLAAESRRGRAGGPGGGRPRRRHRQPQRRRSRVLRP